MKRDVNELIVPKSSVKYYVIREFEEGTVKVKVKDIKVPDKISRTPLNEKIFEMRDYYEKNKAFPTPITDKKLRSKYILTDGYS